MLVASKKRKVRHVMLSTVARFKKYNVTRARRVKIFLISFGRAQRRFERSTSAIVSALRESLPVSVQFQVHVKEKKKKGIEERRRKEEKKKRRREEKKENESESEQ